MSKKDKARILKELVELTPDVPGTSLVPKVFDLIIHEEMNDQEVER